MKARMKILVEGIHDDERFNTAIENLKEEGWKLVNRYGGTLPDFKGHGAELTKNL